MTGVRANRRVRARNTESYLLGGEVGRTDRLTGPSLSLGLGRQLWALPKSFAFCPVLQTMLAHLLSALGPSFAI